jgi:hypothetical protein
MIPSFEVRKQNFQLSFSETGRCGKLPPAAMLAKRTSVCITASPLQRRI